MRAGESSDDDKLITIQFEGFWHWCELSLPPQSIPLRTWLSKYSTPPTNTNRPILRKTGQHCRRPATSGACVARKFKQKTTSLTHRKTKLPHLSACLGAWARSRGRDWLGQFCVVLLWLYSNNFSGNNTLMNNKRPEAWEEVYLQLPEEFTPFQGGNRILWKLWNLWNGKHSYWWWRRWWCRFI